DSVASRNNQGHSYPPKQPIPPKKAKKSFPIFAAAGIAVVLIAALIIGISLKNRSGSKALAQDNCMKSFEIDYDSINDQNNVPVLGNSDVQSGDILQVAFKDSTSGAPKDAWDVSEAQNRSVLAWVGDDSTLYLAQKGGVVAAPDSQGMFAGFYNLKSVSFENFDTSKAENLSSLFYYCSALESLDLSGFDTGSLTDMAWMFFCCSSLQNVDLSSFNTSSVTYMNSLFGGCSSLAKVDLSNFDTGSVTNMSAMFSDCSKLEALDLSNFKTDSVTDMAFLFCNCSSLGSLDIRNFNTGSVTDMSYMFYGCSNFTYLN
ncbi:MAG: BspA family leucine-rich repeat surface protein, partial [Eubacteriales bacterium]|nr:BspA family leucine-rich repeat surface protein [Eubacteriales bacterium]